MQFLLIKNISINLKIKNIHNTHIQGLQFKIAEHNRKTMANRILQLLSVVFNKGIDWNILENNPCKGIKKFSGIAKIF